MKMLCPFFRCRCHEDDCQAFERVKNAYGSMRKGDVWVTYLADAPERESDTRSSASHIYCHALKCRLPIVQLEEKKKLPTTTTVEGEKLSDCPHCGADLFAVQVNPYLYQIECGDFKTSNCKIVQGRTPEEVRKKWEEQEGRAI